MQQKVFNFLCQFIEDNGFPPAYADVAKHFNFKSDGTVRTYYDHLEKKGFIERSGKARGIRILAPNATTSIPILGKIAAGSPTLAAEHLSGQVSEIRQLKAADGRFALEVNGDSMSGAGILNGDIAVIQGGVSVQNGQIAAILVDDHATLKRIYFEADSVRLQPENEEYTPLVVKKNQFELMVLGRYIALIRQV